MADTNRESKRLVQVLFILQETTHFSAQIRLARLLADTGRYRIHFVAYTKYPQIDAHAQACSKAGMEFYRLGSGPYRNLLPSSFHGSRSAQVQRSSEQESPRSKNTSTTQLSWLRRTLRRAKPSEWPPQHPYALLSRAAYRAVYGFGAALAKTTLAELLTLRIWMRTFRQLLGRHGIDVIVLAEDNVAHRSGVFTRVAQSLGLPVITIPYTIANAREFGEAYSKERSHLDSRFVNRLVRRVYPQWSHRHENVEMLRLPGSQALAQEWAGIAPPKPWVYNSGYSTYVVVDSTQVANYFVRAGLDHPPVYALGSALDDDVAAIRQDAARGRAELYSRLSLPEQRPMLLCALPQDQVPRRPGCGFQGYEELLHAWLKPLAAQSTYNVVVTLHPRADHALMEPIVKHYGLRLGDRETSRLVPLCDLYLACVSATIRWAVACGKPVLNYDVYRYQYDDYDSVPGVVTFEEHADYLAAVERATGNPVWTNQLRAQQQAVMGDWSNLDGHSGERLLALFDRLTLKKNMPGAHGNHRHGADGMSASAGRTRNAA